jgi:D-alanine-D-alanine ligase
MLLPHQVTATLVLSYNDARLADGIEEQMRILLKQTTFKWTLEKVSDRPPMKERRNNLKLSKPFASVADKWEISISEESSVVPSVGGLVPDNIPVICGIGPVARDLYTPQESVNRISLIQRTLLTAEFLAQDIQSARNNKK